MTKISGSPGLLKKLEQTLMKNSGEPESLHTTVSFWLLLTKAITCLPPPPPPFFFGLTQLPESFYIAKKANSSPQVAGLFPDKLASWEGTQVGVLDEEVVTSLGPCGMPVCHCTSWDISSSTSLFPQANKTTSFSDSFSKPLLTDVH